jgi:cephalosporin hydroxylase
MLELDANTDKNTVHSYLPLYESLFTPKKNCKHVLEIGIYKGGSIKLWSDFFTKATIHGIDIMHAREHDLSHLNGKNVVLYTSTNAYHPKMIRHFMHQNIKFDVMIDDGPHTLESMKLFIRLYTPLMTNDGILIIEDVQAWEWIEILTHTVPKHLRPFIKTYDLRQVKNRYDDIVFTINLS